MGVFLFLARGGSLDEQSYFIGTAAGGSKRCRQKKLILTGTTVFVTDNVNGTLVCKHGC